MEGCRGCIQRHRVEVLLHDDDEVVRRVQQTGNAKLIFCELTNWNTVSNR